MRMETIHLIDGSEIEILHSPDMTAAQWEETKTYLQGNPDEVKKLTEHSTNPDHIRKQQSMRTIADIWQQRIDDGDEDFAKKMKELEEDPEFELLFKDIKEYRVTEVRAHLDNDILMAKVSAKMGGVPREVRQSLDNITRKPITLQDACKNGDVHALQHYLSETDASPEFRDLDAKDHKGVSCLGYAVGANRLFVAKLLVEMRADPSCVDLAGNSSLHYAAGYGRQEMLQYLLGLGVDVTLKNFSGQTALDVATKNKQLGTVDLLKCLPTEEITSAGDMRSS
ncbi:unnamed protein product [Polarella glacialis]|nr:unnamed protein product [Polarella glacialis]